MAAPRPPRRRRVERTEYSSEPIDRVREIHEAQNLHTGTRGYSEADRAARDELIARSLGARELTKTQWIGELVPLHLVSALLVSPKGRSLSKYLPLVVDVILAQLRGQQVYMSLAELSEHYGGGARSWGRVVKTFERLGIFGNLRFYRPGDKRQRNREYDRNAYTCGELLEDLIERARAGEFAAKKAETDTAKVAEPPGSRKSRNARKPGFRARSSHFGQNGEPPPSGRREAPACPTEQPARANSFESADAAEAHASADSPANDAPRYARASRPRREGRGGLGHFDASQPPGVVGHFDASGPLDTVLLPGGGLIRGTVLLATPRDGVTIVSAATGRREHLAWGEVEAVQLAGAPGGAEAGPVRRPTAAASSPASRGTRAEAEAELARSLAKVTPAVRERVLAGSSADRLLRAVESTKDGSLHELLLDLASSVESVDEAEAMRDELRRLGEGVVIGSWTAGNAADRFQEQYPAEEGLADELRRLTRRSP